MRPSGPMTCDAQPRHGSNEWIVRRISTGWSGFASLVPSSAASYAPTCPFASRGEAFHVEGTTIWYAAIFPSRIVTQCPSAPRGASVKPKPRHSAGQVDGSQRSVFAVVVSPALRLAISRSYSASSQCTASRVSRPRAAVRPSVENSAVAGTLSRPRASPTTSLNSVRPEA